MIKTIAYFPSSCALNSKGPMDAFLDSCIAAGIVAQENSLTADAAVVWSVLWNGRLKPNQAVYEHYRRQNKPVIVIDIGSLYRGQTWKIAVNNINAHGYYGHQTNLDFDRPRKLGISLATQTKRNESIIIAAQHRNSLQVQELSSMEDWVIDTINTIKQYSDRPIVVRAHPRSPLHLQKTFKNVSIETPQHITGTYDNFNLCFNFHALVNYCSGPGVQAAIEDCPVVVNQSSLSWPISIPIESIDTPPAMDRERWFIEITHTEYTVNEIHRGLWIKRLEPALIAPV